MVTPPRLRLPDAPAVVAGHGRAAILTADGELLALPAEEAGRPVAAPCRRRCWCMRRRRCGASGSTPGPAYDLLELFAFVLPARPAPPTPRGLALALDLAMPAGGGPEADAALLPELAAALLRRLAAARDTAAATATRPRSPRGWAGPAGAGRRSSRPHSGNPTPRRRSTRLRVWRRLPEWEELRRRRRPPRTRSPRPRRGAGSRRMLGPRRRAAAGPGRLRRRAASAAFAPRERRGEPHARARRGRHRHRQDARLHRAGQPVGRAQRRLRSGSAPITRHLQRQIDDRTDAACSPNPVERRRRVVVRKGRENYLCLLNFEDAVAASGVGRLAGNDDPARPGRPLGAGDLRRRHLMGGDLPGWFAELFGAAAMLPGSPTAAASASTPPARIGGAASSSTRSAAPAPPISSSPTTRWSWRRRPGAAWTTRPCRPVTCSTKATICSMPPTAPSPPSCPGLETAELRRWLLGAEGGRSRARGLRRRIEELVAGRPDLEAPLAAALQAARALPAPGWSARLAEDMPELGGLDVGQPNPTEAFLTPGPAPGAGAPARRRRAGLALALECDLFPLSPGLAEAGARLERALGRIAEPLGTFVAPPRRAAGGRGRGPRQPDARHASRPRAARSPDAPPTALPPGSAMLRDLGRGRAAARRAAGPRPCPAPRPPRWRRPRARRRCRAARGTGSIPPCRSR